jgi:hypothetical protein
MTDDLTNWQKTVSRRIARIFGKLTYGKAR